MNLNNGRPPLSDREIKAIQSQFDEFCVRTYYVVALNEEQDEISISPNKFITPFLAQNFIEKMKRKNPDQKFVIVSQEISYKLDAIVSPTEIESFVANSAD